MAEDVDIVVTILDEIADLPRYAHPGDAGADLVSTQDIVLAPGERGMVGTGIAMAIPEGFAAFVHPRSGLAARLGLSLVNAPGTVDAGYRGEIKVIVINLDPVHTLEIHRGERIAQLVFQRVARARFHRVERLPGSHRADGGFGSTGTSP